MIGSINQSVVILILQWMPEDYVKSMVHVKLSKRMYAAEPALRFASLLFKFPLWKTYLLKSWKLNQSKRRNQGHSLESRVRLIKDVLINVSRLASENNAMMLPEEMVKNTNRFRAREQGGVRTLRALGIITKAKKKVTLFT